MYGNLMKKNFRADKLQNANFETLLNTDVSQFTINEFDIGIFKINE